MQDYKYEDTNMLGSLNLLNFNEMKLRFYKKDTQNPNGVDYRPCMFNDSLVKDIYNKNNYKKKARGDHVKDIGNTLGNYRKIRSSSNWLEWKPFNQGFLL